MRISHISHLSINACIPQLSLPHRDRLMEINRYSGRINCPLQMLCIRVQIVSAALRIELKNLFNKFIRCSLPTETSMLLPHHFGHNHRSPVWDCMALPVDSPSQSFFKKAAISSTASAGCNLHREPFFQEHKICCTSSDHQSIKSSILPPALGKT